jgi:hypothetical protein
LSFRFPSSFPHTSPLRGRLILPWRDVPRHSRAHATDGRIICKLGSELILPKALADRDKRNPYGGIAR